MSLHLYFSDTLVYPLPLLTRGQQFIWQSFAIICILISVIAVEAIFLTIGFFIVGILNIFLDAIEKLNNEEFISTPNFSLKNYYLKHLEIMVKLKEFETFFSSVQIVQLITSFPLIVAGLFMIRLYPTMVVCYSDYLLCLAQFFIVCLFGEFVHSKTEKIFRHLYLTKWYSMSTNNQLILLIMMKMAFKPFSLKAAGMYEINMRAFLEATKLSFSLCALFTALL